MYDAGVIPFNTKISGTATEGVYNWYAFTTGPAAGTESVSYTHLTLPTT